MKSATVLPCGRRPLSPQKNTTDSDTTFKNALNKLSDYVLKNKLNHSDAREKILEVIVKEARHFNAQDLLLRLKKRYPEVGKATLYRNLPVLVDSHVIQAGPTDPKGGVLYELSEEHHHDHMVCIDCKHIFEFHDNIIEKKQSELAKKIGFTVYKHQHVIYVSCDEFHKKNKS